MSGPGDLIAHKSVALNFLSRIDALETRMRELQEDIDRLATTNELLAATFAAYTVTNGTLDRTYDANSTTTEELADVIYSIIYDLSNL